MQNLLDKYKNIYLAFFYFSEFFILFILPSFLHLIFNFSHSDAFFISLISLLFYLVIKYFRDVNFTNFSYLPYTVISIILAHGIFCSLFVGPFNYSRFLMSIIYLASVVCCAQFLYILKHKFNDNILSLAASIFFYFLLMVGFVSIYGPNLSMAGGKPIFYFDEPSKFALVIIPFFLFRMVKSSNRERLLISALTFKLAILIPSMTLLVVAVIAPILLFKPLKSLFIYSLYSLILISAPTSYIFKYVASRLPLSTVSQIKYNIPLQAPTPTKHTLAAEIPLSTCIPMEGTRPPPLLIVGPSTQSRDVYYSGWLRGFFNFRNTYGMGIGFQQLGFRGCIDKYLIEYWPLNLKDGGTVGAKILNEFGIFGIIFFCYYGIVFKSKLINLRSILDSINKAKSKIKYKNVDLFLDIAFISYFINLFVRGAGYFDASGFLFILSLFSLYKPNKALFKINA